MRTINWSTNPWDLTESESSAPAPLSGAPNRPLSDRAKQILAKPASQRTDAEKNQLLRELQGNNSTISRSRLQESRISSSPKSQGNSFSPQEMDMLLGVVNKAQDITAEMLKGIREGNFHLTETALQQVAESNRASMQLTQAVLTQQKPQFVQIQRANFQQPYPRQRNWLRNEWGNFLQDKDVVNENAQASPCSYPTDKSKWYIEWFDKAGDFIFQWSRKEGFSVYGTLCILGQAYREQATSDSGRKISYQSNNWWNFSRVCSQDQTTLCNGVTFKFACFPTLKEGFAGYVNRITSTPYTPDGSIALCKYNPSFPKLGALFKLNRFPTKEEIDDAVVGHNENGSIYLFCGDCTNGLYGSDILSLANKQVKQDLLSYLDYKINCLNHQTNNVSDMIQLSNLYGLIKKYEDIKNEISSLK